MATRRSYATPQTTGRKSILGFESANSKLQNDSTKKKLNFSLNRTAVPASSKKRGGSSSSHGKDPRPLSDRGYQKRMIEDILDFLSNTGYRHPISAKILLSPTSKEFVRVFDHLSKLLNPNFQMCEDNKYKEEVPKLLKAAGYPFTISKSTMFSLGSLHSWPTLLGALFWMVEVLKTRERVDIDEVLFPPSEDQQSNLLQKTLLEYSGDTYHKYRLGQDDFTEEETSLFSAAMSIYSYSESDIKAVEEEIEDLEVELAKLEAEPDEYEEALKQKKDIDEKMQEDLMAIERLDQELVVANNTLELLQDQIKTEGAKISSKMDGSNHREEVRVRSNEIRHELDRLNAIKETLDKQNQECEISYSKRYDKTMEIVNEYNLSADKLTYHAITKQVTNNSCIKLKFDHTHTDIKTKIKPMLLEIRRRFGEFICALEQKRNTLQRSIDELADKYKEREFELASLQRQSSVNLETDVEALEKEALNELEKIRENEQNFEIGLKRLDQDIKAAQNELNETKKRVALRQEERQKQEDEIATFLQSYCEHVSNHLDKIEREFDGIENQVNENVKTIQKELEYLSQNED